MGASVAIQDTSYEVVFYIVRGGESNSIMS